jgi:hypothetical protein
MQLQNTLYNKTKKITLNLAVAENSFNCYWYKYWHVKSSSIRGKHVAFIQYYEFLTQIVLNKSIMGRSPLSVRMLHIQVSQ